MGVLKRDEFYEMWGGQYGQDLIDILLDLLGQTMKVDLSGAELPGNVLDQFNQGFIDRKPLIEYLKNLGHSDKKIQDTFSAIAKDEKNFDPKAAKYSVKHTSQVIKFFAAVNKAVQNQLPGSNGNSGGKLTNVVDEAIELFAEQGLTFGENALFEVAEIALLDAAQIAQEVSDLQENVFRHILEDRRNKFLETYKQEVINTNYSLDAENILRANGLISEQKEEPSLEAQEDVYDTIMGRLREKKEKRQIARQTTQAKRQTRTQQAWARIQKRRGV